ncbi:Hypothetical protein NocV09_13800010, partial [Nannochloropsis oceanica]
MAQKKVLRPYRQCLGGRNMAGPQTKALIKAAQEALEKGEYGQAYALVPDPGLGGNVPYPLLVCKGLAAQMMGGKAEEAESLLLRATILQPDLPKAWKALVDLYEEGDVVPSDSEDPFEDEGAGKEEGGGEGWREEGLVTHLPRLMAITMAASSPLDWGRVKETSRRILRVSPSCAPAADARILAWWYFPGEEGKEGRKGEGKEEGKEEEQEEEEVLLLARDSLRLRPSSPLPLLHLAWRLMCNGHVIPQALQLLTHATESG